MKLDVKVELKGLDKKIEQANKAIQDNLPVIIGKGATSYADNAAKHMYPKVNGTWSKTIPNKMYNRPITSIKDVFEKIDSKGGKNSGKGKNHDFLSMLGKAMKNEKIKFYVKGRLKNKVHYWLAKTKSAARKFTRIFNRGLLKVMFGANLAENMPKSIQKLLDKSPNLSKFALSLNPVRKINKDKESTITVGNQANDMSNSISARALQVGAAYARGTIKQQAQNVVYDVVKKWNNN